MIRSMTGFGAATTEQNGAHFVVEVRSVNNKFFKCLVRVPEELAGIEPDLEAQVARRLTRGSVVLTVRYTDSSANAAARINAAALQSYLDQLLHVPGLSHDAARIDLSALLGLPGVVLTDAAHERLVRALEVLKWLTEDACDKVLSMRGREGQVLGIAAHLQVIAERSPVVVELYQQRLRQRVAALLAEAGMTVQDQDLLREVAIFAERSDISEEVARLQGHLAQFQEIIDSASEEPVGRTLDFLSQEMLREANTIGSKCLDVEVSRRIVEIKGGIDRLKEQAQNVE
jgi:uncharacterized protein (TIGR00255 family)